MSDEVYTWPQKLRFTSQLLVVYAVTAMVGWCALHPVRPLSATPSPLTLRIAYRSAAKHLRVISGHPTRIVIPASGVDLPVDEGRYDPSTDSWTLTGYRAQFDVMSSLANNHAGQTFIYGHNNNYVFGALRHNTPAAGAVAKIYTANNHIFQYKFVSVRSVSPEDVGTALKYHGPSILTIQTCTGSLNQWRTLYSFKFDKVVQ